MSHAITAIRFGVLFACIFGLARVAVSQSLIIGPAGQRVGVIQIVP